MTEKTSKLIWTFIKRNYVAFGLLFIIALMTWVIYAN